MRQQCFGRQVANPVTSLKIEAGLKEGHAKWASRISSPSTGCKQPSKADKDETAM